MVLEIERKFVLDGVLAIEALKKDGILATQKDIVQFYTQITPLEEVRFRKSDDKFSTAKKIGKGMVRKEFEEICDAKTYKKSLKNAVGMPIHKTRFEFKFNNLPANIDLYHDALEGLATLEIEFLKVEDAQNFEMPEFLSRHIELEITDDERYKNKFLALFGLPDVKFDLQKTLEIIDQNSRIKLSYPSSIRAIDAARAMFFQIYKLIEIHKTQYIRTSDEEALHQIRVNLRKTRSLLKLLNSIFDEKLTAHFSKSFKLIANSTNTKRDIDVFLVALDDFKHASEIKKALFDIKSVQDSDIKAMLTSQNSEEIFRDWEIFLREDSDFYQGADYDKPIKKVVAKAMRAQILKLKKALFALNDECANEMFHETRIELKRFRYLLENFIDLFAIKALERCQTRSKEMQELFGDLQDRDIWLMILENLERENEQICENSDKIKSKIYKQIFKLRDKILDKNSKFIRSLSKVSRNLKIYYN